MSDPRYIQITKTMQLVEGHDFELFCFELTNYEVSKRFPIYDIDGPEQNYVGDGGVDIYVHEFGVPPLISSNQFKESLIPDTGPVCVCCKSGKGFASGLKSDMSSDAAVDAIQIGGSVVGIVNRPLGKVRKEKLRQEMVTKLAASSKLSESVIDDRVSLVDANKIQSFLSHHSGLHLSTTFGQALQIPITPGISTYEQWKQIIIRDQERGWPEYVADDSRKSAIDTIKSALQDASFSLIPQAIWVSGPPGVGKTRLVAEAIEKSINGPRRVFAAIGPEYGRRAVIADEIPMLESAILIFDECPAMDVGGLASTFIARGGNQQSTVIFIGPPHRDSLNIGPSVERIDVAPMDASSVKTLIESELGTSDPELVNRITKLAEGYPWFAILLSRELRTNPKALPEGATNWDAAKIALAGNPLALSSSSSHEQWEELVGIRARILFAVLATENLNWSDPTVISGISELTGLPEQQIPDQLERLHQRGIIRQKQHFAYKYVTPNNLAREVATHLLSQPFDLGVAVNRIFPQRKAESLSVFEDLQVPSLLLLQFADEYVAEIGVSIHQKKNIDQRLLSFSARHNPFGTAREIRRAVESLSSQDLLSDTINRRSLMFALSHIIRRKDGFEDAEAAMFRLALNENETWANNARGTWPSLFGVVLHLTHRTFDERFSILKQRFESYEPEELDLLLDALETTVSRESVGPSYSDNDKLDGDWPVPTNLEIRDAKLIAWEYLFERVSNPDEKSRLVEILTHGLDSAVRWRVASEVFGLAEELVPSLTPRERSKLRESLSDVERHLPVESIDETYFAKEFKSLESKLHPGDFQSELFDSVGSWAPLGGKVDVKDFDRVQGESDLDLARRAVINPELLLAELDWLDSKEASRGPQFLFKLGQTDTKRCFLERFVKIAEHNSSSQLLASYLAGIASKIDERAANALLDDLRANHSIGHHIFFIVARLGLTDRWSNWIIEDIASETINSSHIRALQFGDSAAKLSTKATEQLIQAIASLGDQDSVTTALYIVISRVQNQPGELENMGRLLPDLVWQASQQPISGMNEHAWELACGLMLKAGKVEPVARSAIHLLTPDQGIYYGHDAWKVFISAIEADNKVAWTHFAGVLEQGDFGSIYGFLLSAQEPNILEKFDLATITDWIGSDPKRGSVIAQMVSAHESPLNDLSRWLLSEFGANSSVADTLTRRAHSTPGALMGPISNFAKTQMEFATEWAKDTDSHVATWGAARLDEFRRSYEVDKAAEEHEELRGY